MAQFITLTGIGKIGRLTINLDRLVAYYGFEDVRDKRPIRGSKLDFGDSTDYSPTYEVKETPEEIDHLIRPTGTR